MKERITAQQAYINAMSAMKMPPQPDLDKKITMSGAGGVKMKSKWVTFAAAAAVMALCIGGAVWAFRGNTITTDNSSAASTQLENKSHILMEYSELRCAPHGMSFRLIIYPDGTQGKEQMKKLVEIIKNKIEGAAIVGEGENGSPLITDSNGWHYNSSIPAYIRIDTLSHEFITVDYYIRLNKQPPQNTKFKLMLQTESSDITNEEIANGIWRGDTVASVVVTVDYKNNLSERIYNNRNGEIIRLSDTYFTIPGKHHDALELTLNYTDGESKTIKTQDTVMEEGEGLSEKNTNLNYSSRNEYFISSDNYPNFFIKTVNTTNVTSVTFDGEVYTLKEVV